MLTIPTEQTTAIGPLIAKINEITLDWTIAKSGDFVVSGGVRQKKRPWPAKVTASGGDLLETLRHFVLLAETAATKE